MTEANFRNWLKLYGQAWEDKDIDKFASLFSENANYYRTPFEDPQKGRIQIKSALESAISSQEGIKFNYEILSFNKNKRICRWWCRYNRVTTGNLIKLDGIFLCEFENTDLCAIFREWRHKEGE